MKKNITERRRQALKRLTKQKFYEKLDSEGKPVRTREQWELRRDDEMAKLQKRIGRGS